MFVAGTNHSMFDRSLAILENGDAETEDKVAACIELEGYFSQLVKNETDLVLSPFKTHGGKLMETLLECLEKENSNLRNSAMLVYKRALQLLPKGLTVGMQVASHCYSVLLKTCKAAGGNLEPPSCRTQTLVELFQCMSGFDEPQFLDAVTAATVRYTDHKELIQKCVNVREEAVDIDLEHKQDNDQWISSLRLEALRFVERLMQVCGSLLLEQFEEDTDFWLELLLPSLFVFRESCGSVVWENVDAETRKAARQALEAFLLLTQKNQQLKLENWPKMKKDITDCYADKMVKLVGVIPDWRPSWCLILDILGGELIKRGNNHLINKLLSVLERAFKHERSEVRDEAFVSWRHLIDRLLPPSMEVRSNAVERSVRLLVQPLLPNNAKTGITACQKFSTWWHLVERLGNHNEKHWKTVLVPFLVYSFGCSKSEELPVGKKYEVLHIPCAKALANVLDPDPTEQCTAEIQFINVEVEGCVIRPSKVPLMSKPEIFLGVYEELFYSVGECVVTLSGRSEVEMCSQLVHTIWTSLLRHITVFLDGGGIPAEKVVSLVQDLLRLLQSLTTRSSACAPVLATYCISPLIEELVMGPHAFPPVVLASPAYYVGTAQLMTGTAALFLIEVMVSRPLLEVATTHARYIVVLKAILDVGVSHHNVLEFMQSVIRQLEIAASACHDISSAERASLCVLWGSVADALIKYLKCHMHVNQGDEKHHDLSCFYLVMLFPFFHFYSITYKQAMETLSTWLELYKCFHQVAIQNVSTLDINEVCETVAMKICQALVRHWPTSANQAVPLLKAVQNIIMLIPFGDICGTRQSSKSKSRYVLLPDRGQISKPTNYITNILTLVVKVSRMFSGFERSGEWYNTAGTLIMSCLETVFRNMNVTSITAAVPVMSSLSDCILNLLQVIPLQDGTTKFWHESLHRMWKCYFSFIETYIPQKTVKDFLLGWMAVLLETGFSHPQQEIRDATLIFWDNIVVPAFAKDNIDVPEGLKKAREKSVQTQGTSCVVPDSTCSLVDDKEKPHDSLPAEVFAFPEETDERPKHRQSLLQKLEVEGHILTKHQKEVFRHRKHDIPILYNSTLQPLLEDSIISESSQDTCDFVAPHRIIEPLSSNVNDLEAKEPSVATSLKVLEPPSSLQRLADYRKKMMIDDEGSVAQAAVSESDSVVSTDVCDQQVSSGPSPGVLHTQIDTQGTEHPSSPLPLTLVSHLSESTPLSSNGRKLDLEAIAVHLPAAVVAPSKVTPELGNTQLVHEQDVALKPEVAITVPVSTPVPTSFADSVSGAPVLFPLEELAVCSAVDGGTSEHHHLNSCNVVASPVKAQKRVELPAESQAFPTGEDLSSSVCSMTSISPSSRNSVLIEATSVKTNTVPVQKVGSATKSLKRKPVVNTDNPLTNYFRPVSMTLTADDDDKVDASGTGSARTIHLNVSNSDYDTGTMATDEPKRCQHTLEAKQITPEHPKVLEECPPPPLPCVEVKPIKEENVEKCEIPDGRQGLSPLKVVVERVEDFTVNKTFSALEITPPLNTERKELRSQEVSSRSRRKIKDALKRNAGDPKLPPFKGRSKRVQQMKTRKQYREVVLQDKLPESRGRCSKKKASEKLKALKCPSHISSGIKLGNDDQVMNLTGQETVTGPETNSHDNPSPSLLPAASGRTSSKTKQIKSTNEVSEVIENDVAILQDVKLLELSTTGSQPEQVLNSDTILDDVNTNKHSSTKCHRTLNATSVTDSRQVRTDNLSLCDKEQILDVESSKQNVTSSHGLSNTIVRDVSGDTLGNGSSSLSSTIVREVSGDTHGNGSSSLASNEATDGEVTEKSMPNSAEFLPPHVEMQETNKKFIKPDSCHSKMSLRSANREIQDVNVMDQNMLCKANILKTDSDAQRRNVKYTKQNISSSNDAVSASLREVLDERTFSYISKTEETVPCVQTQNNGAGTHEVHKGFIKAADSEDVIESSQDSNSSLLIASKLPSMQKCSVSVCRIDTTLGPGAAISVPDGGCRHIVLTPEDSSSPFKVYKDMLASHRQRRSAVALSGLGRAHGMKRRSGKRSLNGKYADVNEMDSIQDKPSVSLGINSSRVERTEHPASEGCVAGKVKRSRSEDNISIAGKEDAPKPQSIEEIDASVSKDNILVVSFKKTLKQQADKKFGALESEECILPCCKEDGTQPHSGHEINMSQSEDIVFKKEKENSREPCSKQQLINADSNDNHLSSVTDDDQECHSKQDISKSTSEDTQLTAVRENASKLKRKQPLPASNCDVHVLTLLKEEIPRPEPEQQIFETCGLSAVIEGPLKPREDTVASKCEVISFAESLKARFKHVTSVIPESEPKQKNTMLKPEKKKTTIMKEGAEKSELNSSNCEEISVMCISDDTTELRPKRIGMGKRAKNNSRVKNYTGKQGTKLVLRSSSRRMLTKDDFMIDQPQQLATPESVSTNHCQRKSDKQTKDDDVSSVGRNISSLLNQQHTSDNSGFTDNTSSAKKTPLNESNILDGNLKVPFPLQSRKRRASREVPRRQAATTLDNAADTRASKIKKLSVQNAEDGRLYAISVCDRSVSAPSEVKLCDVASSNSDETPSSPSSKSLVRSPSSLLRAFCSVLGSTESNESQKSHYKCLRGGRARYLLDCAVAVKDIGTWSDVRPEEIRTFRSGTQPSLPLPRKIHLYRMSDGGSSRLGTLQGSVAKCETPSLASTANLANVPCKGALQLAFSEQGIQPSKKKRVWFPDPAVSRIRYFDSGESDIQGRPQTHSPYAKTRRLSRTRRVAGKWRAAGSSGTSLEDNSPISVFPTSLPHTESPCGKEITLESQSSPDVSGLASQGSVNETAPELLNSQEALFPPLVDCTHPIESIAAQLTTKLKWTRAFVLEVTHKNIRTVGDLSRLDEASVNRLPIASPKISHAKTVLRDYMKLLQDENEMPPSVRGVSEGDDTELQHEPTQPSASTETCQRSVADFLKSTGSKRENLAALLKEVSKVWCQYGSGLLEEEILRLLPVESVVQYILSRFVNDKSFDIPVSDYQKFMEAIANRVTHAEFTALFYHAVMANSAQNTGCP